MKREKCIALYQNLLNLFEEDRNEIAIALQGELLDAYRNILIKELQILESSKNAIQKI